MGKARILHAEWKNSGLTLRGSLHVTEHKGAPWFILAHGFTGHRIGPGYLFARLSRELADAGFSSLRFDFAGAGESDGTFPDMTIATMRSDLLSAVKYVKKRFAPKKLVLLGHSLGGMIASICCVGAKPDGLVLLAPVGNPKGLIARRGTIMNAGPNKNGFYENGPHEMALPFLDGLKSIDPVAEMATSFHGSLLLLQGDSDASISVGESKRYADAARRAGIETSYHVLKNADHNFSSVSFFDTVFATTISWAKERFL
jgi:uncharacterized protein